MDDEVFQVKDGPKQVDNPSGGFCKPRMIQPEMGGAAANYLTVIQNPESFAN